MTTTTTKITTTDHDEDHDDTITTTTHDDEDHDEDHDDDHDDDDDDHDHDEGSSGLGAHEHGTAEMSVASIGADVAIDLISPTFNVFGFEYEPSTDEDIAIEADRTEALTAPGVVSINDGAGCALSDPVGTEIERDGSHAEITVSWSFVSTTPTRSPRSMSPNCSRSFRRSRTSTSSGSPSPSSRRPSCRRRRPP